MELFHVHTYRCKHASNEIDEEYVLKAIQMKATDIYFTDHAPFPGNPFGNRMNIEQLDEYISSIEQLKYLYKSDINVHCGLEIEYLPTFASYYEKLHSINELDILMIGQHFCEIAPKQYSFTIKQTPLEYAESISVSTIEGISTGLFSHIAHPDRMFRHCQSWSAEMSIVSNNIISAAQEKDIILERNLSSMENGMYWSQFWEQVPDTVKTIYGTDAHCTDELERIKNVL